MSTIELYDIPEDLFAALDREATRRGLSIEATVLALLSERLGAGVPRANGLENLAGTWSDAEVRAFEEATASLEAIDDEDWR